MSLGVIAQLVERLNGIQKVSGSIPLSSTTSKAAFILKFLCLKEIFSKL